MMASKIPIWLFQKGFGHILINNPAQQGLHHHYLVKRLKELPFPMKSMTLLHILSLHEFSVRFFKVHIHYSYRCKPSFWFNTLKSNIYLLLQTHILLEEPAPQSRYAKQPQSLNPNSNKQTRSISDQNLIKTNVVLMPMIEKKSRLVHIRG